MAEHLNYLTDASIRKIVRDHEFLKQMFRNWDRQQRAHERHTEVRPGLKPTYFRNDSSEVIPACSIVADDGLVPAGEGIPEGLVSGVKPSTTFRRKYFISPDRDMDPGTSAKIVRGDYRLVKYESGWSSPATGESGGPKPGSWELWRGFPGIASVTDVYDSDKLRLFATLHEITTILCKATANLTAGSVSSNYQIWSGTIAGGANSGFTSLPTIEIQADYQIQSGDFFVAHWVNNGWVSAETVPLTEITVLTAWRVDTGTMKFQYKSRTAKVVAPGTESDWTDAHTGVEC